MVNLKLGLQFEPQKLHAWLVDFLLIIQKFNYSNHCEMFTHCWVNELDVHTSHLLQLSDLLLITLQEDISTHTALMRLSIN